jgi:hypothetical protein
VLSRPLRVLSGCAIRLSGQDRHRVHISTTSDESSSRSLIRIKYPEVGSGVGRGGPHAQRHSNRWERALTAKG